MKKFTINKNHFLRSNYVTGYSHQPYTGFGRPDNPNFINDLKNTFKDVKKDVLVDARSTVENILIRDIPLIMRKHGLSSCVCVSVPRAKSLNTYSQEQLYFKDAVSRAARRLRLHGVIDGTNAIQRVKDTRTTHIKSNKVENNGPNPYVGITRDTCYINRSIIQGKTIILIDDIYTPTVNVDEDCIQALFDNGAKNVIFYSIGHTMRRY